MALTCSLLASCAIHPAPGDYDKSYTLGIVQSIRCEARDGIQQALVEIMKDPGEEQYLNDADTQEERRKLEAGGELVNLRQDRLHPQLQTLLSSIKGIVVIYDFRFELTETNTNSVSAGLRDVVSAGLFDLGLGAAANLTRQNTRSFRTVDVVEEYFVRRELDRTCQRSVAGGRFRSNILYPLAGRIGLAETLRTYLLLVETAGLSKPASPSEAAVPRTLVEKLTFTTELSVGADPKLTLEPATDDIFLASAIGSFKAARKDVHEVTVALSLAPSTEEYRTEDAIIELNRRQLLDSLQARRGF
ncbi:MULTISPECIES: hypothetical protein [unclassified Aureimonas]|uniref:hypothetical protein n=1 Tax=unclassified Aureimonas TaxID=2615206 RepID=UPI0012E3BE26|nr:MULTISPECIES: hypothetical protein [unclassified Aureimonas]